jgi:tetratricopeptide (TPR) repeat protein
MPCIKRFGVTQVVVVLALLQGCSSLGNTEKQAPENVESLNRTAIDTVEAFVSEKPVTDEITSLDSAPIKSNVYLEQAQQRLRDVPVPVLTKYQRALLLMKNKAWPAAEKLFDQILVSQPQLSGAYVNKALIAFNKDDLDHANDSLNKALAINSKNPYAHQLQGQVARLKGQFVQAEKSYLAALTIWPDYPEAQINLAILLELYRGRLLDARKYYISYLALRPDDEQVQRWLAGVELKIKRAGLTLPKENDGSLSFNSSVNVSGAS